MKHLSLLHVGLGYDLKLHSYFTLFTKHFSSTFHPMKHKNFEADDAHCNTRGTFLKHHGFQNLPFLSLTHQVYPN
jgi:hypothetical protein